MGKGSPSEGRRGQGQQKERNEEGSQLEPSSPRPKSLGGPEGPEARLDPGVGRLIGAELCFLRFKGQSRFIDRLRYEVEFSPLPLREPCHA